MAVVLTNLAIVPASIAGAASAISLRGSVANYSMSTNSVTLTLGASVSPGDLLTVASFGAATNITITGITGGGTSWSRSAGIAQTDGGSGYVEIWAGPNASGSSNAVTVTYANAQNGYGEIALFDWANAAVAPLDQTGTVNDNNVPATSWSSPSLTPTVGNELFFAMCTAGSGPTPSTSGGWVVPSGQNTYGKWAYLIATDSAAHSESYTQGNSGYGYAVAIASYKPNNPASMVARTGVAAQAISRASCW